MSKGRTSWRASDRERSTGPGNHSGFKGFVQCRNVLRVDYCRPSTRIGQRSDLSTTLWQARHSDAQVFDITRLFSWGPLSPSDEKPASRTCRGLTNPPDHRRRPLFTLDPRRENACCSDHRRRRFPSPAGGNPDVRGMWPSAGRSAILECAFVTDALLAITSLGRGAVPTLIMTLAAGLGGLFLFGCAASPALPAAPPADLVVEYKSEHGGVALVSSKVTVARDGAVTLLLGGEAPQSCHVTASGVADIYRMLTARAVKEIFRGGDIPQNLPGGGGCSNPIYIGYLRVRAQGKWAAAAYAYFLLDHRFSHGDAHVREVLDRLLGDLSARIRQDDPNCRIRG